MSEPAAPPRDERVHIFATVLGERVELLMPGNGWSYNEAKLAKAVSDGMSPQEIGLKFFESDPDATMAILRVTFARAKRQLSPSEIAELNELDLEAVAREVMAALEAAAENSSGVNGDSPPAPASAGDSPKQTEPEASATAGPPSSDT